LKAEAMQISVEDAQDILDEFVDRALAGEDIILMLDGRPAARLVGAQTDEPESQAR